MKNPFIAIAAAMGVMLANARKEANARFYTSGKAPSRRNRRISAGPSGTGNKLARKASEHRFGTMRGQIITNLR